MFDYDATAKTLEYWIGDLCFYTLENVTFDGDVTVGIGGKDKDTNSISWLDGAKYTVEVGTPVPEPTALALLALGVAGLALRRRVA